jgi:pre-mRNA-processing factor 17
LISFNCFAKFKKKRDIPVDFKYLADPQQHSMPYVTLSRNGRYLAFQSMDNQIRIMEPNANFRWKNKKVFRGHMVAGYACGIDFSPDMNYIISGDADGNLAIWDWKTTKLYDKIKSHSQVCMDVKWHPHETSKILTCGWDGVVNLWD